MVHRRGFLGRALATLSFATFESRVMQEARVSSPMDLTAAVGNHFVVLQVAYEFNDETYFPSMEQAGFPFQVFSAREGAEALARKLNHHELRGIDLQDYYSDPTDIWDGDDLPGELKAVFGDRFDAGGLKIPADATDEELDRIKSRMHLTFFDVYEIPASNAEFA